ncbi:GntR family transcriptional regulator [Hephaestia sp. GCM10023244]|uniref:GntR family transcriptional regulator n=1 Tax=unclassified Hephaestia TaxID=2631281 RepID=UPI00207719B4|nr:GntR family transcriptional regulator [Hephaestia sp. MAHUQ-44]MCM8729817.1 GntR family transcriptional regulator [Hephaestia sp. MAHUQ-44]
MTALDVDHIPAADDGATIQERVYDHLRGLLMRGEIQPGQKITLRGAAEALDVSMMPVRGALQRLEAEGALIARGGKRVLGVPDLDPDSYREIRDIRVVLEGLAAERAVDHIRDAEIATTRRHCAAMQSAADAGDVGAYVLANWAFHRSVYKACRMPTLTTLIEAMWLRVGPYVPRMMPDRASLVDSMATHWAIVDALARRDGKAARRGIVDDISASAVALIHALETTPTAVTGPGKRKRGKQG